MKPNTKPALGCMPFGPCRALWSGLYALLLSGCAITIGVPTEGAVVPPPVSVVVTPRGHVPEEPLWLPG